MTYPHIEFLASNESRIDEENLPTRIRTRINKFAKMKADYEEYDGEQLKKDEMELALEQMSNEILSDLEDETGYADDIIDVRNIAFKHKAQFEEYKIDREKLPDDVKTDLKNFDSIYGMIANTTYDRPDHQKTDIGKAKELSKKVFAGTQRWLDSKRMDDVEKAKMKNELGKIEAEIKALVGVKDFEKAGQKLEKIKEMVGEETEFFAWFRKQRDEYLRGTGEKAIKELNKLSGEGKKRIDDEALASVLGKKESELKDIEKIGEFVLKQDLIYPFYSIQKGAKPQETKPVEKTEEKKEPVKSDS